MRKRIILATFLGIQLSPMLMVAQTTIDQKLLVVTNSSTNGGPFQVAIQVKGTNLTSANTLASATIDVTYDKTKIRFVKDTLWAFSFLQGYSTFTTVPNTDSTFVHVGVTGGSVNPGPGFDITSSYVSWVQLNFIILNSTQTTTDTIIPGSNQIALWPNHSNDPTGPATDQTLSPPINITNVSLPIQLASFTAVALSQGRVHLDWTTLSELNNYGFFVQRRRAEEQEYTELPNSFVPGHGTTTESQSYSYVDSTAGVGDWWYRLRQVDLDATVHFTEGVHVDVLTGAGDEAPREFALFQNYPNPFNPTTEIKFSVENTGHATLHLYNVIGQLVAKLFDDVAEAGHYYKIRLNGSSLASGMYLYKLESGKKSSLRKMLLVK